LIILVLLAGTLVAASSMPALRAWIDALPLRALVGINAVRFVGITFLVLAARGEIAPVFAARAGWGDIATAVLALVLVAAGEPRTALGRGLTHAWNAFGLLDLDRKSTRLNSSHVSISYAVFCLKKKKKKKY